MNQATMIQEVSCATLVEAYIQAEELTEQGLEVTTPVSMDGETFTFFVYE